MKWWTSCSWVSVGARRGIEALAPNARDDLLEKRRSIMQAGRDFVVGPPRDDLSLGPWLSFRRASRTLSRESASSHYRRRR